MPRNPHYLSQLAHLEIVSPDLDASVRFFSDIAGLDETGRDERSVYLRAWGDYFHHSLKITRGDEPALGHLGWRADSPEALADVVAHLETDWRRDRLGGRRSGARRAPTGSSRRKGIRTRCSGTSSG